MLSLNPVNELIPNHGKELLNRPKRARKNGGESCASHLAQHIEPDISLQAKTMDRTRRTWNRGHRKQQPWNWRKPHWTSNRTQPRDPGVYLKAGRNCYRCGMYSYSDHRHLCRSRQSSCHYCSKLGYYSSVCVCKSPKDPCFEISDQLPFSCCDGRTLVGCFDQSSVLKSENAKLKSKFRPIGRQHLISKAPRSVSVK